MRLVGIDVGINGGCAKLDSEATTLLTAVDIPTIGDGAKRMVDVRALYNWLHEDGLPEFAYIERAVPMPSIGPEQRGMGATSAFHYGGAFYALLTVIILARVPYQLVMPGVWKKYFGLKGGDKENSRLLALQRFPNSSELFSRKKDHQRAEAALIALYGWETRMRAGDNSAT